MTREYYGIDPGAKGAIAGLTQNGKVDFTVPFAGSDLAGIIATLQRGIGENHDPLGTDKRIMIEKPIAMPYQHAKATATQWQTYGIIIGWLYTEGYRYKVADPRSWPKAVGASTAKKSKDRKAARIAYAKKRFNIFLEDREPSDGEADAMLIARYGFENWENLE